jgi:DnaJ-class molecular chaperone
MNSDNRSHYSTLGIPRNASQEEIHEAYRRCAKKFHPDSGGVETNQEKFLCITEAYETLGNEKKRRNYDYSLENEVPIRFTDGGSHGRSAAREYWPRSDWKNDLFGAVYDESQSFDVDVVLSPGEVARGCQFQLVLPIRRRCPQCSDRQWVFRFFCPVCRGTGAVESRSHVDVLLPPGMSNGDVFRVNIRGAHDVVLNVRVWISP